MSNSFVPHILFGLDPLWVSATVLVLAYALIISGRINRAIVALIAGSIVIVIGALDQSEAIAGIDWNTIGLLAGMMILVSISRRSGMFQYLAIWSAQKTNANPAGILLVLQLTAAAVSALLNNVSTVLLLAPVTLAITDELEVPPFPFLFAVVFASNIGGTATLIGDPPNILIGSLAGLDFNAFLVNLAPVVLVVMLVQAALVHLLWGRRMQAKAESRALVMGMHAPGLITDWMLLRHSAVVIGAVLVAFVSAGPLHLQPATIALAGAAALMVLDNWKQHDSKQAENVHRTFSEVEWITIFFFIGLFVLVHAVEVSGLLRLLAAKLVTLTGAHVGTASVVVLWLSAALSAVLDNIPFVATMIPLIKSAAPSFGGTKEIEPLWWALALGACLGGNATLIGASANLTMAGIAERNDIHFGFGRYLRYGLPMTLLSIAICQIYIWLRYF